MENIIYTGSFCPAIIPTIGYGLDHFRGDESAAYSVEKRFECREDMVPTSI